jgi:prolipoprotein diacylglyceryltransferase
MYPVLFKIDPVTVYSLGLFWALGTLAAVWILRLELKRHGYDPEVAGSAVFAAAAEKEFEWRLRKAFPFL